MSRKAEKQRLFGLLLVAAALFTWLAAVLPIHVDEAITHQHFCSQGWKIAISSYPFPNNHVLFSLLGSFVVGLPLDSIFGLRFISIISGLGSMALIYKLIRLRTSSFYALSGVVFWMVTLGGAYYSIHARGYGLQLFLLLTCLYLVEKWSFKVERSEVFKLNSKAGIALSVFSALGFFTIPTFLFPFTSLLILILYFGWKNGSMLQQGLHVVLIGGVTSAITALLYAPLFYYSGVLALIDNQWVRERGFANVGVEGVFSFAGDVMAYGGYIIIPLAIGVIIWAIIRKSHKNIPLLTIFYGVPLCEMIVMGSVPFPRTFAYLIAVSVVVIFSNIEGIRVKGAKTLIPGLVIVGAVAMAYLTYQSFSSAKRKDSARSEEIQKDLQACCDGKVLFMKGWNECAQMIDYFSWRTGIGPTTKIIYQEDFWVKFNELEGSLFFQHENALVPDGCKPILENGNIRVYKCN